MAVCGVLQQWQLADPWESFLVKGSPAILCPITSPPFLSCTSSTPHPLSHLRNMFDKTRKWITITYLSTMLITIFVCFVPLNKDAKLPILVLLLAIQLCCSLWYSLSYIPFARRSVKKFLKNALGLDGQG